ncbi:hypothetical protein JCM11641_002695 [Rhodosporidiobolus odoratus]
MDKYTTHRSVSYPGANDVRQSLDLYLPSSASPNSPLLVFIHGGAWRSESKDDFVHTLVPNLLKHTDLPLAILEYRLAPCNPHPAQINDVVSGLSLLTGPPLALEGDTPKWDRKRLFVAGHSAGAFMAASLVFCPPPQNPSTVASSSSSAVQSRQVSPSFAVPAAVRRAITGIICIDGIYDLPSLLAEYPSYHYFVDDAFGKDDEVLASESPARWDRYEDDKYEDGKQENRKMRVLVLHSMEDELLSLRQPRVFLRRLKQLYGAEERDGRTADYETDERDERDLPDNVEVDFGSIRGTHGGLLEREELARVIALRLR